MYNLERYSAWTTIFFGKIHCARLDSIDKVSNLNLLRIECIRLRGNINELRVRVYELFRTITNRVRSETFGNEPLDDGIREHKFRAFIRLGEITGLFFPAGFISRLEREKGRDTRENLERDDSVENKGCHGLPGATVAVIFRSENFINKKVSQRREHEVDEWSGNKKFGESVRPGILFLWVTIVFQKITFRSLSSRRFHPVRDRSRRDLFSILNSLFIYARNDSQLPSRSTVYVSLLLF